MVFTKGVETAMPSTAERLDAAEALKHSPIPALRKLRVEESEAVVVLSGSVATYYLKQLAQETVMPVLDRRELRNQVTVTGA